ncbi:putative xylosidase/arabinosidase [Ilyonectria robusta]|uniref:putative xylosidase/arabinosidase n=1 Tax=Ilyonectria robusta TaxID=1079257 RepID=UPI001E8D3A08|nr:putative xylosidase/arabinosidase [Ilyonectria robusta]KAH8679244.1 putative xylosidase/arabinosidase [Ilyonectria robusta]
MNYHNPIIPGFAPDPSVIFVESEGTFFLVNSSFHFYPGLPIYASKDLQDWAHIGNAINRVGQIPLGDARTGIFNMGCDQPLVPAGGLFAPTIRWNQGTFYVVCTNFSTDDIGNAKCANFYVTTTDIWSQQWSDPVYFDFEGIDPSIFFDDDGRVYIQGSWRDGPLIELNCTIRQFEIDIKTGKRVSEIKQIWEGYAGKKDPEGPHIYKKDGYYYLVAAEGGTFEGHMISIARSRNIWGPYETAECNPILTANGKAEDIRNTGHGELFQDGNSRWWCVCLGVRYNDGRFSMGRETFLTPVEWSVGGWPKIDHPQLEFSRDVGDVTITGPLDSFKPSAATPFIHIRDPALEDFRIAKDTISLIPRPTDLSSLSGSPSFIGQRQRHFTDTATVALDLPSDGDNLKAGLTIFKDEHRHADIYYDSALEAIVLRLASPQEFQHKVDLISKVSITKGSTGKLGLRIQSSKQDYSFSFSSDGEEGWRTIGSVPLEAFAQKDFTGTLFGVFAVGDSTPEDEESLVTFRSFQIKY